MKMKEAYSKTNFFGRLFIIVLIIEMLALWLSLLVVPGLLILLTKNAMWALLYIATLPLFLFVSAYLENQKRINK